MSEEGKQSQESRNLGILYVFDAEQKKPCGMVLVDKDNGDAELGRTWFGNPDLAGDFGDQVVDYVVGNIVDSSESFNEMEKAFYLHTVGAFLAECGVEMTKFPYGAEEVTVLGPAFSTMDEATKWAEDFKSQVGGAEPPSFVPTDLSKLLEPLEDAGMLETALKVSRGTNSPIQVTYLNGVKEAVELADGAGFAAVLNVDFNYTKEAAEASPEAPVQPVLVEA